MAKKHLLKSWPPMHKSQNGKIPEMDILRCYILNYLGPDALALPTKQLIEKATEHCKLPDLAKAGANKDQKISTIRTQLRKVLTEFARKKGSVKEAWEDMKQQYNEARAANRINFPISIPITKPPVAPIKEPTAPESKEPIVLATKDEGKKNDEPVSWPLTASWLRTDPASNLAVISGRLIGLKNTLQKAVQDAANVSSLKQAIEEAITILANCPQELQMVIEIISLKKQIADSLYERRNDDMQREAEIRQAELKEAYQRIHVLADLNHLLATNGSLEEEKVGHAGKRQHKEVIK